MQPPGICWRHACQEGVGGLPSGGGGARAPTVVNRPLPILVGAFCAGTSLKKNGPPRQFWMQQAGGLLVFTKCLLEPFLVAKGTTNIGRGIEFLIIV
jgi:hypothetical protein